MLVKKFKFKRNNDKGGFQWMAHSEIEHPGFYRGFTAVGNNACGREEVRRPCAPVRRDEFAGTLVGIAPARLGETNADVGRQLVSAREKAAISAGVIGSRQMRRETLVPFVPAALAAVTDVLTTGFVLGHQPDYPGRFIVFQIVMLGAALLAAVPNKWVRFVGFVIVLAGVYISGMSVGVFYLPTFFAVVWVMVRNVRPPL